MAELDEYLTADEGEEDRVDHFADFKRSNSLNKAAIFRKFLFQKQISSKRGHKKPKKIRNRYVPIIHSLALLLLLYHVRIGLEAADL